MFIIDYYKTESGRVPIEEFIDSIEKKLRAKLINDLSILEELGNNIREPYSKHITKGIFELRVKLASDIARVFYFFIKDNRIILTNGFIKKTQKTPKSEIEIALKYKKDYERRY